MADLIGQPDLIGPPNLIGQPNLTQDPGLIQASFLMGAATANVGFTPPDFGFTVSALAGEIGRMWVETGGGENVFNLISGSEAGTVYQDEPALALPDGPTIRRLRVFSSGSSMRFHSSGVFMSTWAAANDGGVDEPDLSFHFFTSATNTVQRRLQDRSGAGGGFLNFSNNTGVLAGFFNGLRTADVKLIIVLANAS